ncbi:hypothetical protein L9F63_014277 [Diploptera punctata]|uniref:Nondiscriminating glutamyl-tRNA synthetase EARS2, mitochondrial n=1 Tax=Diploptera punctata TaxID=6984 RepID=A0AAD8A9K4_DIPPU|nr:hypothetical protein L9F63_014277 [Diploptera punctata]
MSYCKKIFYLSLYKYTVKRFFSSSATEFRGVRVRFAPSPTGHLHLGGLRTALYNYLFAKLHGGKFILRIEDTDQTRLVPDAVEKLENDLKWVGIIPDESPLKGGPYGPYKQSERLSLYRIQVKFILNMGAAYHCFCSDRRLDLLRREALRSRQIPRYDNRCRHLSESEVKEKLEEGKPSCIRFKLSSDEQTFDDAVYGRISYNIALNEGDPVIMKTDGFPTYHFANVVDDHLMNISHVLRGVEWQISTTKHIMLYRAFGWKPPIYAHLPLILNPDGSKLSKRQGDIRVENFRNEGIFPEALLNYVVDAGGGFSKDTERKSSKIYSTPELAQQFDLKAIKPSSCHLSPDRLTEFNSYALERKLQDEKEILKLTENVKTLVTRTFQSRMESENLQLQDKYIVSVLNWSKNRITTLNDLVKDELAFLWTVPSHQNDVMICFYVSDVLQDIKVQLSTQQGTEFTKDHLKIILKDFSIKTQFPFNRLMKLLRHAVSGLKEGPGVAEMMEILGQTSTLSRLDRAITFLKTVKTKQ